MSALTPEHHELPEPVGAGSSGCVVVPPAHCVTSSVAKGDDGLSPGVKAAKVVFSERDNAALQSEEGLIRAVDPNSEITFPLGESCELCDEDREHVKKVCKDFAEKQERHGVPNPALKASISESTKAYQMQMARADGDISQLLRHGSGLPLDFSFWVAVMYRLILAMDWLSSKHIIHGDLKPDNVAISMKGEVWTLGLIDFGSAAPLRSVLRPDNPNTRFKQQTLEKLAAKEVYIYTPPECCYLPTARISSGVVLYDKIASMFPTFHDIFQAESFNMRNIERAARKLRIELHTVIQDSIHNWLTVSSFNVYQLGVTIAVIIHTLLKLCTQVDSIYKPPLLDISEHRAVVNIRKLVQSMCAADARDRILISKCKDAFIQCLDTERTIGVYENMQEYDAKFRSPGIFYGVKAALRSSDKSHKSST